MVQIANQERRTRYAPAVSTTAFEVGFPVAELSDLEVWVNDTLLATSEYTVTGTLVDGFYSDATVTLDTGVTGTVDIVGARPPFRIDQFVQGAPIPATTWNQVHNRIQLELREVYDKLSRALVVPFAAAILTAIPTPVAGKVLGVNSAGTAFEWVDGGATGPAGPGVPAGGSTSQVLAKASGTSYDTEWVNPSVLAGPAGPGVAAGGATGQVLVKASNTDYDTEWSAAGAGDLISTNDLNDVNDVATARSNLGLAIGTNVQAWSARLDDIAALGVTDGNFMVGNGSTWVAESGATARTSLGLAIGTNVLAYYANVNTIGGLSIVAGDIIYGSASNTFQRLAKGSDGQFLTLSSGVPAWASVPGGGDMLAANNLSEVTPSTARSNLGLVIGTDVQAYDAELAALAGLTSSADELPYFTGSGTAALTDLPTYGRTLIGSVSAAVARLNLGLAIGANVQAYNANLQALSGVSAAANRIPYFTSASAMSYFTFLDEDNMASNSATGIASQQSIKAYVDTRAVPSGGSTSQVLAKASASDYDLTWVTVATTPGTATEGEIVFRNGANEVTFSSIFYDKDTSPTTLYLGSGDIRGYEPAADSNFPGFWWRGASGVRKLYAGGGLIVREIGDAAEIQLARGEGANPYGPPSTHPVGNIGFIYAISYVEGAGFEGPSGEFAYNAAIYFDANSGQTAGNRAGQIKFRPTQTGSHIAGGDAWIMTSNGQFKKENSVHGLGTAALPAIAPEGVDDEGAGMSFVSHGSSGTSTIFSGLSLEIARFDPRSSGAFHVGKQAASLGTTGISLFKSGQMHAATTGGSVIASWRRNTSGGNIHEFYQDANFSGSISVTSSSTSFNTSSDHRLKTSWRPVQNPLERLMRLRPYTGQFLAEPGVMHDYMLAHELQQVLPYAVTGDLDGVNDNGVPIYQQADYSKTATVHIGATQELYRIVQEQKREIDELRAELEAIQKAA